MGYKTICKQCKKHKLITKKRICWECTAENLKQGIIEMQQHKGPQWDKWRKGYKQYLDDEEERIEKLSKKTSRVKRPKTRPKSKKPSRKRKK
ncbi:unnamed protein product [marine sediment metagenome]|uniref:Uncharacterized protein n=1 Tax=marine sediment metagenome TaxID=412755 RepID=X1L1J2_9ZZZZ